jgi:hypothetical protein
MNRGQCPVCFQMVQLRYSTGQSNSSLVISAHHEQIPSHFKKLKKVANCLGAGELPVLVKKVAQQ